MKKFINVLSIMLVAMLILSVFAGCGNTTSQKNDNTAAVTTAIKTSEAAKTTEVYPENGLPKDQNVTLKIGFFEGGYGREYMELATNSFMEKFPNVRIMLTSSPNITKLVDTKAQAGNDEDMYDIFYGSWLPMAKAGKVEPLDDIWEMSPYDAPGKKLKDLTAPGLYENRYIYEEKTYYMPHAMYVGGLFFDENFFDKNGWNKDPKTWDEFIKLCEDIKGKGVAPIAYAGKYNYQIFAFDQKVFELADITGNKEFKNNWRTLTGSIYTSPEMLEKFKRLNEMGKKGYFAEGTVGMDHTQSQMMAIQNKAAMVISGDWIENEMKDSTPEGFKWGFMGVPFVSDPNQTEYLSFGQSTGLEIWAGKPDLNKKWSKQFLLYLMNLNVQQILLEKGGALSVRNDYLSDPERAKGLKSAHKAIFEYMTRHKVALEAGGQDISLTDADYNKAMKIYNDSIALMVTGQKEPQPILEEVEKLVQSAIKNELKR